MIGPRIRIPRTVTWISLSRSPDQSGGQQVVPQVEWMTGRSVQARLEHVQLCLSSFWMSRPRCCSRGCGFPYASTIKLEALAIARMSRSFSGPTGSRTSSKRLWSVALYAKVFATQSEEYPRRRAYRWYFATEGSSTSMSAVEGFIMRNMTAFPDLPHLRWSRYRYSSRSPANTARLTTSLVSLRRALPPESCSLILCSLPLQGTVLYVPARSPSRTGLVVGDQLLRLRQPIPTFIESGLSSAPRRRSHDCGWCGRQFRLRTSGQCTFPNQIVLETRIGDLASIDKVLSICCRDGVVAVRSTPANQDSAASSCCPMEGRVRVDQRARPRERARRSRCPRRHG